MQLKTDICLFKDLKPTWEILPFDERLEDIPAKSMGVPYLSTGEWKADDPVEQLPQRDSLKYQVLDRDILRKSKRDMKRKHGKLSIQTGNTLFSCPMMRMR